MVAGGMQDLNRSVRIDRRASRIADPVKRLRYLRRCAKEPPPRRHHDIQLVRRVRSLVPVLLWSFLLWPSAAPTALSVARVPARVSPDGADQPDVAPVWQVETRDGIEFYSNGLQVQTASTAPGDPRPPYPVFRVDSPDGGSEITGWRRDPAGIVYHSSESHQAAFEPAETAHLIRIGRGLIDYVRRNHSYHYVVDRFGRVWRVVPEGDEAFHAGFSIWGEPSSVFVNLNPSFLGIALESEAGTLPNGAQVHATRVLTNWLRSRYKIPARNCVAHAQVSVNPDNMRLGYHTDWADGFPFGAVGLPDNYEYPTPAIRLFGFTYDNLLLRASGGKWTGLTAAQALVRSAAAASGRDEAEYSEWLRRRYRAILKAAKMPPPGEENRT